MEPNFYFAFLKLDPLIKKISIRRDFLLWWTMFLLISFDRVVCALPSFLSLARSAHHNAGLTTKY